MKSDLAVQLTDANFEAEVLKFPGVVLIDFWAVWCVPCQVMTPRIAQLAEKYKDNPNVKIAQLNIDEEPNASENFQIRSIPSFITFAGGEQVNMSVGVQPTAALESMVEEALKGVSATPAAAAA